jgi:hypothetical protein
MPTGRCPHSNLWAFCSLVSLHVCLVKTANYSNHSEKDNSQNHFFVFMKAIKRIICFIKVKSKWVITDNFRPAISTLQSGSCPYRISLEQPLSITENSPGSDPLQYMLYKARFIVCQCKFHVFRFIFPNGSVKIFHCREMTTELTAHVHRVATTSSPSIPPYCHGQDTPHDPVLLLRKDYRNGNRIA